MPEVLIPLGTHILKFSKTQKNESLMAEMFFQTKRKVCGAEEYGWIDLANDRLNLQTDNGQTILIIEL